MPIKPTWLLQVTGILEILRTLTKPLLDRSDVEKLLSVKRRRAQQLIEKFGGFQVGRRFLIERDTLQSALERLERGDDAGWERSRRARFEHSIEDLRREQVARSTPIPRPAAEPQRLAGLPSSISIKDGALEIRFENALDLLSQLYSLSQAITGDFERFERLCGGPPDPH